MKNDSNDAVPPPPPEKGSSAEHSEFWRLRSLEQTEGTIEEFQASGMDGPRDKTMAMFIRSYALLKDPKRYLLFFDACERIGESAVRELGIEQAIVQERKIQGSQAVRKPKRSNDPGIPPCPDCGGKDIVQRNDRRRQYSCQDCFREFGPSRGGEHADS
jgi:hypothetical protein